MTISADKRSWIQTGLVLLAITFVWWGVRDVHEQVDSKTGWRARAETNMQKTSSDLEELLKWKRELELREQNAGTKEKGPKPWEFPTR